MPRPLRPIDDRLVYHVINRDNNRADVFHDDGDYTAFLKAIGDLKKRRPFELYGYRLMPNHIHLLIRALDTPISRIMQSLLVSHTQRYHRRHRSGGHVWQGRFKSPVIQDDDHLLTVLRYIEANPLRARMVERAGDYCWSSFACHGLGRIDPLLDSIPEYEALAKTPKTRQRRWSAFVHQALSDEELAALRRSSLNGLPFGDCEWVNELEQFSTGCTVASPSKSMAAGVIHSLALRACVRIARPPRQARSASECVPLGQGRVERYIR